MLLIIEVADTTLEYDRETKLPRYARAGIPEAWLVDLGHDIVEVYTDPTTQGYGTVLRARPGEVVPSSVVRPQILADEILPRSRPEPPRVRKASVESIAEPSAMGSCP